MKEKKLFSKMPNTGILTHKNGKEKFREVVEGIYNDSDEVIFKNIANKICKKIVSNDLDNCWTIEDYRKFRMIFRGVEVSRIDILGDSIEVCLGMSNSEIYGELELLGKQVDWYPFRERIKNKSTNQYISLEKNIQVVDFFEVANCLVSYMSQFIEEQAMNCLQLFGSINAIEDISSVIEQLKENSVITDSIMIEFENRFGFVKKYSLFIGIYSKIENTLMERIYQNMFSFYGKEKMNKERKVRLDRGASTYAIKQGYWQKADEKEYHVKYYSKRRPTRRT